MAFLPQQADFEAIDQEQRNVRIRIDLMNGAGQVLDSLEGGCVSDSYRFDAGSDIRKTYDLVLEIEPGDESFQVGRDKKVFHDRLARVYAGIYHLRDREFRYYSLGVFLINEASYGYGAESNRVSLNCLDLMARLNGARGGVCSGAALVVPANNTLRGAAIDTLEQLGGVFDWRVEPMSVTVLGDGGYEQSELLPYDLSFGAGATVADVLKKLMGFMAGWEMFFDENVFVMQPMRGHESDLLFMDAGEFARYVVSEDTGADLGAVKNVVELWGKALKANRFAANSDDEPGNVVMSGATYELRFSAGFELSSGYTVGFVPDAGNAAGVSLALYAPDAVSGGWAHAGTFPALDWDNAPLPAGRLAAGKGYVFEYRESGADKFFYLLGEPQICAVCKLVSAYPSPAKVAFDLENEPTSNIFYWVSPNSPFCSDFPEVGEIRAVLSGGEFSDIYSERLAADRAKYECWKTTDLVDVVSLSCVDIPFLDVNAKVEYFSHGLGKKDTYIVKEKKGSSARGEMGLTLVRFQPLYPWL